MRTGCICPTCSFENSQSFPKRLLNIQGAYRRNHTPLPKNQLPGTYNVPFTVSDNGNTEVVKPRVGRVHSRSTQGPRHSFGSCSSSQRGHCLIPWKSQTPPRASHNVLLISYCKCNNRDSPFFLNFPDSRPLASLSRGPS